MANITDLDEQRRDCILNAALDEFVAQGYENASTNTIAKNSGISKSLLFHYVKNKQQLFCTVIRYFVDLIENEYLSKMNYEEKDILARLWQSYVLQLDLIIRYPGITELHCLQSSTGIKEIDKVLKTLCKSDCAELLLSDYNTELFRPELDIQKCSQFILWSNEGFIKKILNEMKSNKSHKLDKQKILTEVDSYISELRKVFYRESNK